MPERETITRSALRRLSVCNSKKIPLVVEDEGRRKEYVGIGWLDVGEPDGSEVLVVEG